MAYVFNHLICGSEKRAIGFSPVLPALDRQPNGLTMQLPSLEVKYLEVKIWIDISKRSD